MDDGQSLLNEPRQPGTDPATEAFMRLEARVAEMEGRLDGRMAMMTRALEHIAIEKQSIEFPDYSPTLAKMNGHLAAIAGQTKAMQDTPALRMTPETMAAEIMEAAMDAREADKATIRKSLELHGKARADLDRVIGKVRTKEEQRWRMLWCGIGTALMISLLWLIYPGWVASIGLQGWLWPERVARRTLGEASLWDAGVRLMRAGNPEGWQAIIDATDMRRENRDSIAACETAAAKTRESVRCTIRIGRGQL